MRLMKSKCDPSPFWICMNNTIGFNLEIETLKTIRNDVQYKQPIELHF